MPQNNPKQEPLNCGHTRPDWNGEGDCITCARDKVLGTKQEAEPITGDDLFQGTVLSDNRFGRFDDEVIDNYFNEDGKRAIQAYISAHTTKLLNEQLDRLEEQTIVYKSLSGEIAGTIDLSAIEKERERLK